MWTTEKKETIIASYVETMEKEYDNDEDRAKATTEVAAELAEIHGEATNGVISVLSRAGVYYKKSAVVKAKPATAGRINKAEAHKTLTDLVTTVAPDNVDVEIISKLTGKAALYFAGVLSAAITE